MVDLIALHHIHITITITIGLLLLLVLLRLYYSGWWFGTWILLSHIFRVIIPTDELIFFIGVGQPPASYNKFKKNISSKLCHLVHDFPTSMVLIHLYDWFTITIYYLDHGWPKSFRSRAAAGTTVPGGLVRGTLHAPQWGADVVDFVRFCSCVAVGKGCFNQPKWWSHVVFEW